MRKYSRVYILMLVSCAVLFLIFGNGFLLAATLAQIALPGLLWFLQKLEAENFQIESRLPTSCIVGRDLKLEIAVRGKRRFTVSGILIIQLEIRNLLLNTVENHEIRLALDEAETICHFPVDTSLCGAIQILWKKADSYDLFGLTSLPVKTRHEQNCVIYPRKVPVELVKGRNVSVYPGEGFQLQKKGSDFSEILGMRDYQPGDDIRSIHWKLSGKMGKAIVREAGSPSHYYTMVLFDAGLHGNGDEENKSEISAAMELATTISGELLRLGIPHCVGIPSPKGFEIGNVHEGMNASELAERWMKTSLLDRNGMVLRYFFIQKLERRYKKIIYITAGNYASELEQLGMSSEVTAISIQNSADSVGVVEQDHVRLIQIPVDLLFERTYSIKI